MLFTILIAGMVAILNFAFSWLPTVDALPTVLGVDFDYSVGFISDIMHGLIAVLPPFEIVFYGLLWYFSVRLMLLGIGFIMWLIEAIR